ncbi:hypothetical protein KCP70_06610 [Salmonella enterica subsp. enterica]|nr:hypothetical protein KCP70_06610 [Salmonella enterica subsp. enterica]
MSRSRKKSFNWYKECDCRATARSLISCTLPASRRQHLNESTVSYLFFKFPAYIFHLVGDLLPALPGRRLRHQNHNFSESTANIK